MQGNLFLKYNMFECVVELEPIRLNLNSKDVGLLRWNRIWTIAPGFLNLNEKIGLHCIVKLEQELKAQHNRAEIVLTQLDSHGICINGVISENNN